MIKHELCTQISRETGYSLDEAEEIKAEPFEKDELLRRIYAGEIRDAKKVAGIMAYAAREK